MKQAEATRRQNARLRVPTTAATLIALVVGLAYLVDKTWALPHTPTPGGWLAPEFSVSAALVLGWVIGSPLERYWRKKKVPDPGDFAFEFVPRLFLGVVFWFVLVFALLGLEALGVGRPSM